MLTGVKMDPRLREDDFFIGSLTRGNPDRLEARVRATGAGLEAIEVGAGVGAGQVQDLAAELPVLLDLLFRLGGAAGELAVLAAGVGYVLHDFLEARMVELQMD